MYYRGGQPLITPVTCHIGIKFRMISSNTVDIITITRFLEFGEHWRNRAR